jgi:hypothetical protein
MKLLELGIQKAMHNRIRRTGLLTTLFILRFTSVQAQSAFLRKDIQVPGQYGPLEIQVFSGRIILEGFNGDGRPDLLGEAQK